MERSPQKVHFIGIAGVGMSALAKMLLAQGCDVSGSDLVPNALTNALQQQGAAIYSGHLAKHVQSPDLLVVSSAISSDNPEYLVAKQRHIPIIKRGELLAQLMSEKKGIAIAGSHGKTSTSALLIDILRAADVDFNALIGGTLNSIQSNAHIGRGDYFVAEADESDQSFLHMHPEISVVTNISPDHLVNYDDDFEVLKSAFKQFLRQRAPQGLTVLCADDEALRDLKPLVCEPVVTYGFHASADLHIVEFKQVAYQSSFFVRRPNKNDLSIQLNLPGRHNALNAVAAIAVAMHLGVEDHCIVASLEKFQGIARRFHCLGERRIGKHHVLLAEDYGHHPKEIAAMIQAAREAWPDRFLAMAFQPHRYTRTQALFDEFVEVLQQVDQLYLLPIYAASEAPIDGVNSEKLLAALEGSDCVALLVKKEDVLWSDLKASLSKDAMLLIQGAGDINRFFAATTPDC